jgi:polyisoprenoid-binding protein YceI
MKFLLSIKPVLVLLLAAMILAACANQPAAAPAGPTQPAAAATQSVAVVTELPAQITEPPASATQPPAAVTQSPTGAAQSATSAPASGNALTLQIVPGDSTVSYEVGETFFNENNRFNLAKGITPQVSGTIQVDMQNPQNSSIGPITIDISQFTSDSGRRDNMIRRNFLESSRYPTATFTPTSLDGLPSSYNPSQPLTFKVTGDLTVRQVTIPVTFDVTATLDQGALQGTATTTIKLSDFGIVVEIANMLKTEDQAKLTLNFVAR